MGIADLKSKFQNLPAGMQGPKSKITWILESFCVIWFWTLFRYSV